MLHIYRVMVRGRFADLDDETRAMLVDEAGHHEPLDAAFTAEGTLSYRLPPDFFTFRYQLRVTADAPDEARERVEAEARVRAEAYLAAWGLAHRDVTVHATDLQDVWR